MGKYLQPQSSPWPTLVPVVVYATERKLLGSGV